MGKIKKLDEINDTVTNTYVSFPQQKHRKLNSTINKAMPQM
jgi:hypothetical protein